MVDAFHFFAQGDDADTPYITGAAPNPSATPPPDDAARQETVSDGYIGETEKSALEGDVVRNAGLRSDGELVQAVSEGTDDADVAAPLQRGAEDFAQITGNGQEIHPTPPPPPRPLVPIPYPNVGAAEDAAPPDDAGFAWEGLF